MAFKTLNWTGTVNSFMVGQENKIFLRFLTLLSNRQKSESKNSNASDWQIWSGSSKLKKNFPVSNLLHSFNFKPLSCKYAAMPMSLVLYIFYLSLLMCVFSVQLNSKSNTILENLF